MNEQDTAVLKRILESDPESLTSYDIKFLNARRDYLNKEQRRVFASVLVDEDAPHILEQLNGQEAPESTPEPKKEAPVIPTSPTRKELSDKAIALGIDGVLVKKAKTNADIEALIAAQEAKPQIDETGTGQVANEPADPFAGGQADPDAKV